MGTPVLRGHPRQVGIQLEARGREVNRQLWSAWGLQARDLDKSIAEHRLDAVACQKSSLPLRQPGVFLPNARDEFRQREGVFDDQIQDDLFDASVAHGCGSVGFPFRGTGSDVTPSFETLTYGPLLTGSAFLGSPGCTRTASPGLSGFNHRVPPPSRDALFTHPSGTAASTSPGVAPSREPGSSMVRSGSADPAAARGAEWADANAWLIALRSSIAAPVKIAAPSAKTAVRTP